MVSIDQAVDIVYLWVNGDDPVWQTKRLQAERDLSQASTRDMAVYANVEGRYRDNDELRFSLRALDQYFPEHGHVYIVTDQQVPSWLKPCAGLSIIDHKDLIPQASLPIFDSGNIETYIHRISGLSERYFYCNDDVFFGAPVDVNEWFHLKGIFTSWSDDEAIKGADMSANETSLHNGSHLSRQWLANNTNASGRMNAYLHTPRTFAHAPRPMLKTLLASLESLAPELFTLCRSTQFRVWDKPTIVSDFVLRWALAHGVAQLKSYQHRHVSTGDKDVAEQLALLESELGNLDFFCINDTTDDASADDHRLAQVRTTLERMFRVPSRFETV